MVHLFDLPPELLLATARRLDARSRLALGTTCRTAAPLVVYVAICGFSSSILPLCPCYALCKLKSSRVALTPSEPDTRKPGHAVRLYDAEPASLVQAGDEGGLRGWSQLDGTEFPFRHPWRAITVCGSVGDVTRIAAPRPRHLLRCALDPAGQALSLSSAHTRGLMLEDEPARVRSLSCSLVSLDLSRAAHLATICGAGLRELRSARLPPAARVACFSNCGKLEELRPTAGCERLLSLQLDGCRQLEPRSLGSEWRLGACEEIDLSYCTNVDAGTLAALLPTAGSLRSLSLRGLGLGGVVEAVLASPTPPCASLAAADLGFSSGLRPESVLELVARCASLARCNLRAAGVSRAAYNEVGLAMQERQGQSSGAAAIENRRRPKKLAPRAAPAFYYLGGAGSAGLSGQHCSTRKGSG